MKIDEKAAGKYFANIDSIFQKVRNVPGHILELGVYQGRTACTLGNLIKRNGVKDKKYYGFDSFCGYMPEDIEESEKDNKKSLLRNQKSGRWDYSKEKVEIVLTSLELEEFCEIIEGDIKKTVPAFLKPKKNFAISILYVDCNAYLPSITAMNSCYDYLSNNSLVIIDEHRVGGETRALKEFAEAHDLKIQDTSFKHPCGPSKFVGEVFTWKAVRLILLGLIYH